MPRAGALPLASLLLAAAALAASPGLGAPAKEKRGWTLNSAGYLLGPHALDSHRSFQDKHVLTGKRELLPEDAARPGGPGEPQPGSSALRAILELLSLLHRKEASALGGPPEGWAAVSSEDDGERF